MDVDLERFVESHERDFARALGEIEHGRKQTHWMWYVFPQIVALGRSRTARHYGIHSIEEARAFLGNPVLGSNYRRIVEAVRDQVATGDVTIHLLFGSPDDVKLVSSLTLFRGAADPTGDAALRAHVDEVLAVAEQQGLAPCNVTAEFLDPES